MTKISNILCFNSKKITDKFCSLSLGDAMENDQKHGKEVEKPEDIIDDIVDRLDNLHDNLVKDASMVGQARDAYKAIKPIWVTLGDTSTEDPDVAEIYAGSINALISNRDYFKFIGDSYQPISRSLGSISSSSDFMVSATNATASFIIHRSSFPIVNWLQPVDQEVRERTREGLLKLDTSLAKTYDEIWEILYGTRSDPERGSLYLIRQVFDGFFNILAPDDKVRQSEFWKPKKEPKIDEITRSERILYAAHNRIKDIAKAKLLIDSSEHMLQVYKALNRAHERGLVDQEKARTTLKEMQSIIESWVNALFYS